MTDEQPEQPTTVQLPADIVEMITNATPEQRAALVALAQQQIEQLTELLADEPEIDDERTAATVLSPAHTAKGRLQRALLALLDVHEREDTLPTSGRFLFYELVQAEVIPGARRADQNLIDALTHLREAGLVPWDWIVDETRSLDSFRTASTVAEYLMRSVRRAALDRWGGDPAPLILCESRSLAGVLHDLAGRYACPIAPTNGQCRGFLITKVAPTLRPGRRVLYLGDWDRGGHQIEAASRATLDEHAEDWDSQNLWERVALTEQQIMQHNLPIIAKLDRRYAGVNGQRGRYFDAVETEAFGQANIVAALQARLDALMPEPLADVLERQRHQREQVAEQLRQLGEDES